MSGFYVTLRVVCATALTGGLLVAPLRASAVVQGYQVVSSDLALSISDDAPNGPDPVTAGGTVSYAIAVENLGPDDSTGVTVAVDLPAGTDAASASGQGWTCVRTGDGPFVCYRDVLAAASTALIGLVLKSPSTPPEGGMIAVHATAGFAGSDAQSDPNPDNNIETETTLVQLPHTIASIRGTKFTVNGQVTYPGRRARGLLLNSRMANAVFDDENPDTVGQWAYPDTHVWDPQRNTDEFVAMLPKYAEKGLNMVTVSLQGANPDPSKGDPGTLHPEIVTAFEADGSLKPAWLARLDEVIRAADTSGIIVDVSLFYRWQDERITTDAGIVNAVSNVTDFLMSGGYTNVLLEICNECNVPAFEHANLKRDEVWKLIQQAQERSGGQILTSSSFGGIFHPPVPESVIQQADFISLHCNNQTPSEMTTTLQEVRATAAYQAEPKPIMFTECGTDLAKMETAIAGRAGWGFYNSGLNNYVDGFQSPPINWHINTDVKRAFFAHTRRYAGLKVPSS